MPVIPDFIPLVLPHRKATQMDGNRRVIDSSERARFERVLQDVKLRVRHDIVVLDVELASKLLDGNTKNRALKSRHVAKLREAQLAKRWVFNGEPICVADSGRLLNGQHRCAMVVETGEPILVLLITGLPESVFSTYDTGSRRTAADVLHILGQSDCRSLGSALGWVEKYFSGHMESREGAAPFSLEELLEEHHGLVDSVRLVRGKRGSIRFPAGLLAALHHIFGRVSKEQADKFVSDLYEGAGLSKNDAVFLLRERLIKDTAAKAKLPVTDLAALAIKAWNFRLRGAHVGVLKWRTSGDKVESFPRVEGIREDF